MGTAKKLDLQLPDHVREAAHQGQTGEVASYIQSQLSRWKPTDCYRMAATIVDRSTGHQDG